MAIGNMKTSKTFCQDVREGFYSDTIEQFAQRLNTSPATVAGWEAGQDMQEHARALLEYASKHYLFLNCPASDEFVKLSPREQVTLLMNNFGDTQKSFAKRIGVSEHLVGRWVRLNVIAPIAQRYIYEVAAYPDRFHSNPKSYAK